MEMDLGPPASNLGRWIGLICAEGVWNAYRLSKMGDARRLLTRSEGPRGSQAYRESEHDRLADRFRNQGGVHRRQDDAHPGGREQQIVPSAEMKSAIAYDACSAVKSPV